MARRRLTTDFARRAPFAGDGRTKTYTDTELKGFYLRVNCRSKSWIAQRSVRGRPIRVTLGRFPDLNASEAREGARQALAAMGQGMNPSEERRRERARGITLREALELHLGAKELRPRTVSGYRDAVERYLADWRDRPLRELGEERAAVRERHQRISERHGPAAANGALRVFRAAYNRAVREHPELPPNPCSNVDFNRSKRRKVDLASRRLLAWGRAVLGLPNSVRRDLHLFMLLTGMRRSAACSVRAEHIDLAAGTLHVPSPKGGPVRAFDLPLSGPLVCLGRYRLEENSAIYRGTPWLFPATSRSGHVAEVKEQALFGLHGHELRHAYSSLALEAGVPFAELKFLLNHSVSDVTFGYLSPSLEHLRACQERATARILVAVGLRWVDGRWPPALEQSDCE